MLNALVHLLCPKLCQHNWLRPSYQYCMISYCLSLQIIGFNAARHGWYGFRSRLKYFFPPFPLILFFFLSFPHFPQVFQLCRQLSMGIHGRPHPLIWVCTSHNVKWTQNSRNLPSVIHQGGWRGEKPPPSHFGYNSHVTTKWWASMII